MKGMRPGGGADRLAKEGKDGEKNDKGREYIYQGILFFHGDSLIWGSHFI
jgi:hypothetical protein